MNTPSKISKKIAKYITDSFSQIGSFILNKSDSNEHIFYSPTNSLEDKIELSSLEKGKTSIFDESLDWSRDKLETNDSIMVDKTEYEKLKSDLQEKEREISENKSREEEYKRLLIDFDNTISFIMEKNENNNVDMLKNVIKDKDGQIDRMCLEIDKLTESERRLKIHISSLETDLINSEERNINFRNIAKEKIDMALIETEKLRELYEEEKTKVGNLNKRISELEGLIIEKGGENLELLEYCKFLLKEEGRVIK